MNELWTLFWAFLRIGTFTFGGGYAMLPMLQKEVVDTYHWTTEEELMDFYAIGQCTPGVIAVNTATFIGYKQKGLIGGITATLGVVFPSLVIITVIASVISNFSSLAFVQSAFVGIRIVVAALVINVVIKMLRTSLKDWIGILIFLAVLFIGLFIAISPIYTIIGAAIIGILVQQIGGYKNV
nr:chromate transporter [uncultured Cellulosilyticum sp.]